MVAAAAVSTAPVPLDPSRELILARIRDALAGGVAATARGDVGSAAHEVAAGGAAAPGDEVAGAGAPGGAPSAAFARTYGVRGTLEPEALIELLCERIGDYRAEVRRVSAAELPTAIAQALAGAGAARVCVPSAIPPAWRPVGVEVVEDASLSFDELDRVDGVLTGCTVAIAETGTIVLSGGPTEGRRAISLVPDLHICVVGEEQVVETVPEAMAQLGELVRAERRPLTFISGPSATSDIELNRVEGVHGPRLLIVLVVSKETA
jgi:L-lactate dehydrogenase complex protein LldG